MSSFVETEMVEVLSIVLVCVELGGWWGGVVVVVVVVESPPLPPLLV